MKKKPVPFLKGKVGIHRTKDGYKMVFERADSTFCCIDTMGVWGNKLEADVVIVEGIAEFVGAFVVENV